MHTWGSWVPKFPSYCFSLDMQPVILLGDLTYIRTLYFPEQLSYNLIRYKLFVVKNCNNYLTSLSGINYLKS